MTSADIKNVTFDKKFGGYKAEQVDEFLDALEKEFQDLQDKNADLTKKISVLVEKIEEYRNDEANMKEALLGAQKLGAKTVKEAEEKAANIVEKAELEAKEIIEKVQIDEQVMRQELDEKIQKQKDYLVSLETEVADFKDKLLKSYKVHTDLINALPGQGYYTDQFAQQEQEQEQAEEVVVETEVEEIEEQDKEEEIFDTKQIFPDENEEKYQPIIEEEIVEQDLPADEEEEQVEIEEQKPDFTSKFGAFNIEEIDANN